MSLFGHLHIEPRFCFFWLLVRETPAEARARQRWAKPGETMFPAEELLFGFYCGNLFLFVFNFFKAKVVKSVITFSLTEKRVEYWAEVWHLMNTIKLPEIKSTKGT